MVAEKVVTIENCTVLAITRNAVLVECKKGKFWIPKAVIHDPESFWELNSTVSVTVELGYARKEKLI